MRCQCGLVIQKKEKFFCTKCGNASSPGKLDLDNVKRQVQVAVERLTSNQSWEAGLEELHEAYRVLERLCPPLLELHNLHISVWKAIWTKCGNKKLSKLF